MINAYRTEEEQIEAIKRWWKTDGLSTIAMIVLAAAAYFGWQQWQAYQQNQSAAASAVFQSLIETDQAIANDEGQRERAIEIAADLKENHGGNYALFGSLYLAKYAVANEQLETAETELQWVLDQGPSDEVGQLAQLRLARVLYAQSKYEAALAAIVFDDSDAWSMKKYELQGDIYLAQGQAQHAVTAFEKALTFAEGRLGERTIKLKMNSIQVPVAADE